MRERAIKALLDEGYLVKSKTTPEERKSSGRHRVLRCTGKEFPTDDFDI
jgi:hypothetical protein